MDSFKLLATVFMLGLDCGIWSKEEIISWCDKVIESKPTAPQEIYEVSLMSKARINDVVGKMSDISGEVEQELAVKMLLSIVYAKVNFQQLSIEKAINCTSKLLILTNLFADEKYYSLYSMDDSFDMAKNYIHFDIDDVVKAFITDISKYDVYFIEFKQIFKMQMQDDWIS